MADMKRISEVVRMTRNNGPYAPLPAYGLADCPDMFGIDYALLGFEFEQGKKNEYVFMMLSLPGEIADSNARLVVSTGAKAIMDKLKQADPGVLPVLVKFKKGDSQNGTWFDIE